MAIKRSNGTIEHTGRVIGTFDIYYGDYQGTYFASIWNPEKGAVDTVSLGEFDIGEKDEAEVDGNFDNCPGLRELVHAKINAVIDEKLADLTERQEIAVGDEVVVVKGRKLPKGTKGKAFWIGDSGFGTSVGLTFGAGRVHGSYPDAVFVSWGSVKLAKPVTFELSDAARAAIVADYEQDWFGANSKFRHDDVRRATERSATRKQGG
jgi:hypothetical protein